LQELKKNKINTIKILKFIVLRIFGKIADNGSGLCDGGAKEAQNFNFTQILNRRTTVELCSFAPLAQNPC